MYLVLNLVRPYMYATISLRLVPPYSEARARLYPDTSTFSHSQRAVLADSGAG